MTTIDTSGRPAYMYDESSETWYAISGRVSTSANYVWSGAHQFSNNVIFDGTITANNLANANLIAPKEKWNISATAVTATTTVDFLTAQNWQFTTASTAGACTINIRGNSGTTLDSILATDHSATFTAHIATGAGTPAYFNAVQIDGTVTGVTVRWQYGATPTSGTANGYDLYSFSVIKTAATPTYTVLASVAKW